MGGLEAGVENSIPTGEHKVCRKKEFATTLLDYFHPRLCETIFCANARHTGHVREGQAIQLPRWSEAMGLRRNKSKGCHRCSQGNCCYRKTHQLCFFRGLRESDTIFKKLPSKIFSREGARGRAKEELPQRAKLKRQGPKTWWMLLVRRAAHGERLPTEIGTQCFNNLYPSPQIGQGQCCRS